MVIIAGTALYLSCQDPRCAPTHAGVSYLCCRSQRGDRVAKHGARVAKGSSDPNGRLCDLWDGATLVRMYVLRPFHYYLALLDEPDITEKLQLANPDGVGRPDLPGGGRIILPEMTKSGGFGSDPTGPTARNNRGSVLTLQVGRVLWHGPGKHYEGGFVKPEVKRGDLVLFSPRVVSHDFRLHGRKVSLVPWSEVLSGVVEVDSATFEREVDPRMFPRLEDIIRDAAA